MKKDREQKLRMCYEPPRVVDLGEVARAMSICLGGLEDVEACGGGNEAGGGGCGGGNGVGAS